VGGPFRSTQQNNRRLRWFKICGIFANTKTAGGNPKATAEAILKIADAETPPLRVFFGKVGLPLGKKCICRTLVIMGTME
jgi:hypothetical protein